MAPSQRLGRMMLLCAVTFLLAYACLYVPRGASRVSPIWIANGLLLTILLRSPRSLWFGIVAAGFLGDLAANFASGDTPLGAFGLAVANSLEFSAAAFGMEWVAGRRPDMTRPSVLIKFGAVAMASCIVSAIVAAGVLAVAQNGVVLTNLVVWLLADFVGLLIITPCAIALATDGDLRGALLSRKALPVAALLLLACGVFSQTKYPLLYLLPSALLFVTLSGRLSAVAASLLGTLVIATVATMFGHGPFHLIPGPIEERFIALQIFVAVCFYVSLPVASGAVRELRLAKNRAEALSAQQEEARKVLMAQSVAQLGYWRYDVQERRVTWSDQIYDIFGVPRGEPLPIEEISNLIHPEDRERYLSRIGQAIEDGQAFQQETYRIVTRSGEHKYLRDSAVVERDHEGAVVSVHGAALDCTDLMASLEAQREIESRFRLMAEHASDIFVRADLTGRLIYISPSCRRLGYDPEDLIGSDGSEILHPDDRARYAENAARLVIEGRDDFRGDRQHRYRCKDGSYRWLEGSPSFVRNDRGEPVEIFNIFRDVTDRREAEAELAQSEESFRLLAQNASDLIIQCLPNGEIIYISPACLRLTGYTPEEVLGSTAMRWVHPEDRQIIIDAFQAQLSEAPPAPVRIEYRIRTKDGRERWFESAPAALRNPETGDVQTVTDVARDITLRKMLEHDLFTAKNEAEAATRVKADFLANMSHELRTPLTSILGFARFIREQPELQQRTLGFVDRLSDASRALLSAVNDILDFSKLEAGEVTFRPEPIQISSYVRDTLELLRPQATAKGLSLVAECDIPDSVTLVFDPDRMRQVFLNLLSNAVKFTDEGSVTLRVKCIGESLSVEVQDTGAGIPEDKLNLLFRRFSQLDGSLTRAGGTGLGLAICKAIVEAQQGQIGVRSEVGAGSTFHFTTPVQYASPSETLPAEASAEVSLEGLRVLVADDHAINRELVRLALAGLGVEVTEAQDGETALHLAHTCPFDIILLDFQMPDITGPEAAARIRAESRLNATTPIYAFTARAELEDPVALARFGFDGFIGKPLAIEALLSAVANAALSPADMSAPAVNAG